VNEGYENTIAWLYALDVKRGMDFRLERLGPVLDRLGRPEASFPALHVAGTNGKGSTAAMLHSIYRRAGYRTGLYTSPHLLSFRERIRVDSRYVAESAVVARTAEVREAMEAAGVSLTFFEIATLMAFLEFRAAEVDLAVVEVGLGGRLDATNVVRSAGSAIVSIDYDHCEFLGSSMAEIAWEKAGIIRPEAPLVTGDLPADALAVIAESVARAGCRWIRYGRDFGPFSPQASPPLRLAGSHQRHNAAVARALATAVREVFPIDDRAIEAGIAAARWPGRLETLSGQPKLVVDAAHNPHAVRCLRDALRDLDPVAPRVLLFAAMRDKDWAEMLSELVPAFDHVVLVPVAVARTFDPAAAAPLVSGLRACTVAESASAGLAHARAIAGGSGTIVVTGSIFLVAELYRECGGEEHPFEDPTLD